MTEENNNQAKPPENNGKEENKEELSDKELLDKANNAAERIEKANRELRANLDRQEAMEARMKLGGKSDAGEGKKEETPEEYKTRVMRNEL